MRCTSIDNVDNLDNRSEPCKPLSTLSTLSIGGGAVEETEGNVGRTRLGGPCETHDTRANVDPELSLVTGLANQETGHPITMNDSHMTMTDLAEALDLSKGQVSKLAARGMPTDSIETARAWRAQNLHPSWSSEARGEGGPSVGGGTAPSDFWASKARKEAAQAELAEIELARAKHGLCEVDRVHRALFAAHRMLRDQLLAVPNRLAAQLVGLAPQAGAELIRAELRRCLEEFSQLEEETLAMLVEEGDGR